MGDALADIREGRAGCQWFRPSSAGEKAEDRHLLAGVVGAAPGRIVAVVGGEDQQIVRAQRGDQLGQAASKASSARA